MIISKYILFIKEVRRKSNRDVLRAWILVFYNDLRKLFLWILFFIEGNCYILIITPVLLQILSLWVIILWSSFKQRLNKVLVILNESFTIIFWLWWVFSFNWVIPSENGAKVMGILMEIVLIIIIGFEIAIFAIQDALDIRM